MRRRGRREGMELEYRQTFEGSLLNATTVLKNIKTGYTEVEKGPSTTTHCTFTGDFFWMHRVHQNKIVY